MEELERRVKDLEQSVASIGKIGTTAQRNLFKNYPTREQVKSMLGERFAYYKIEFDSRIKAETDWVNGCNKLHDMELAKINKCLKYPTWWNISVSILLVIDCSFAVYRIWG